TSKSNFRTTEIPIVFTNRTNGASKLRIRDVVEFVYCAYNLNPQSSVRKFIRFCLVGFSGVVVNLGTLTFLVGVLHVNPLLSGSIAVDVSIASNFLLNNVYTFRYNTPKQHGLIHRFSTFHAA